MQDCGLWNVGCLYIFDKCLKRINELNVIIFEQEKIDKAMDDYELIEEFYYNLSTDDFNAK